MNITKLRKLKKWVLDEPRRYNQYTLIDVGGPYTALQHPPCGTVACLAGLACLMEGLHPVPGEYAFIFKGKAWPVEIAAKNILGLSSRQSEALFSIGGYRWSHAAYKAYFQGGSPESRARAAAMELDRLIKLAERRKRRVASRKAGRK